MAGFGLAFVFQLCARVFHFQLLLPFTRIYLLIVPTIGMDVDADARVHCTPCVHSASLFTFSDLVFVFWFCGSGKRLRQKMPKKAVFFIFNGESFINCLLTLPLCDGCVAFLFFFFFVFFFCAFEQFKCNNERAIEWTSNGLCFWQPAPFNYKISTKWITFFRSAFWLTLNLTSHSQAFAPVSYIGTADEILRMFSEATVVVVAATCAFTFANVTEFKRNRTAMCFQSKSNGI